MRSEQSHERISSSSLVRQFNAVPPGKLFCLHGDRSVFRLSLYAASYALLNGIPIALLDGGNHFDLYYISEFARRAAAVRPGVTPESLLENIFVSRAFTCYQMEAAVTERLPAFLQKQKSSVAIIFGLLNTFYDDQAPLFEVRASLRRIIAVLQQLKKENISVLLASLDVKLASRERTMLFPTLLAAMDVAYTMTESEAGPSIIRNVSLDYLRCDGNTVFSEHNNVKRRTNHGTHSANIHNGYSAGDGKLDKIPSRLAERRSRSSR